MNSTTKIYGLILSGGKSTRMGMDKGEIAYRGLPHREYLFHLLSEVCDKTYVSIRSDQESDLPASIPVIIDLNEAKGPFNGMLSAAKKHKDGAWLVLACDLPLVDRVSVKELIKARDPEKKATAYALSGSDLPEPLFAVWEPAAFDEILTYLAKGNGTCPRKYLINSDIKLIHPERDEVLMNANSMEEYRVAMNKID